MFTLTHYLADLFARHRGPRSITLCTQHHIQLTFLSFQVSRPSYSWDTAISIFCLENPRSRSWVKSNLKVKTWVQHSIVSHAFRSISIGLPIPEIQQFQYYFNILENPRSRSWLRSKLKITVGVTSYRLTSLSFHVNRPFHPWDTKFSKSDLENPRWRWNDNGDVAQLQV